jgi:hypothetical protein
MHLAATMPVVISIASQLQCNMKTTGPAQDAVVAGVPVNYGGGAYHQRPLVPYQQPYGHQQPMAPGYGYAPGYAGMAPHPAAAVVDPEVARKCLANNRGVLFLVAFVTAAASVVLLILLDTVWECKPHAVPDADGAQFQCLGAAIFQFFVKCAIGCALVASVFNGIYVWADTGAVYAFCVISNVATALGCGGLAFLVAISAGAWRNAWPLLIVVPAGFVELFALYLTTKVQHYRRQIARIDAYVAM